MQLLSHWHCILPVIGIAVAFYFMREKPKEKKSQNETNVLSQNYNED